MESALRALEEAEAWRASAKYGHSELHEDEARANVCCAQAIHAIIRANDALSLHFLGTKPTRHDDLPFAFMKLVRQGKIEEADGRFFALLSRAASEKSGADYGKKRFSAAEAAKYVQGAEEFVAAAKKCVR